MIALYAMTLLVPDPALHWAWEDEVCCHVPTIRAIQDEGLRTAVTDKPRYRSATAPVYHLIMAAGFGRVDSLVLRIGWTVVMLGTGFVLYQYLRSDPALHHSARAGVALASTFLLSPTVRAAAAYFVTDGLAPSLAIASLVVLRRAGARATFSMPLGLTAIVLAFSSFYTRQYYLWAALYVAFTVFFGVGGTSRKTAVVAVCCFLAVPGMILFRLWHGFAPPLDFPILTQPLLTSTVPNALGLLAVYSLPLAWVAFRDQQRRSTESLLWVGGGMVVYLLAGFVLGFRIPEAGGILRVLNRLGALGPIMFLAISYVGLVLLVRWLAVDGPQQLWWAALLLPLFAGSILLQRYFEPAILVFLFLVARPADAVKVLDSRLVWFYPLFAVGYALSRMLLFASNS